MLRWFFLVSASLIIMTSCSKDRAVFETNYGMFEIELDSKAAPKHARNFINLVENGTYNGLKFHRIVPGFLIQGGDPLSKDDDPTNDGMGGLDYKIDAEISASHLRGTVAAARQGDQVNPARESNASQFYICLRPLPLLDGNYSAFGKVVSGMESVDKISKLKTDPYERPLVEVVILRAYMR